VAIARKALHHKGDTARAQLRLSGIRVEENVAVGAVEKVYCAAMNLCMMGCRLVTGFAGYLRYY